MASATIILLVLLILATWRFVFAVLPRAALREIAGRRKRRNLARLVVASRLDSSPRRGVLYDSRDRAKTYLRRVVSLTNATQMGDGYILNVGTTRFHVRHRYAKRLREVGDGKCRQEQTCFYSKQIMPDEEQIATVLLQLKSNPALFDKWAAWNGPFKADGQMFHS